ncbi:MAG: calcium-translocating P-type ATPase, PMCA-type, partial [Amphiamblys sp. WSBS2006]
GKIRDTAELRDIPNKLPLSDKTLLALGLVSLLSLFVSLSTADGILDPCLTIAALLGAALASSVSTWRQEKEFTRTLSETPPRNVKIVEGRAVSVIKETELTVGDVLCIDGGDVCTVDGILKSSYAVLCDESAISGETETVEKSVCVCGEHGEAPQHSTDSPAEETGLLVSRFLEEEGSGDIFKNISKHCACNPFVFSGTKILSGSGTVFVLAVGRNTHRGRTLATATKARPPTVLQKKLQAVVEWVTLFSFCVAAMLFTFHLFFCNITEEHSLRCFLSAAASSLALVVFAVPEGLPVAAALSVSLSASKMLGDGILVREPFACETMGRVTTICCDKTGTLTENKMRVVALSFSDGIVAGMEALSEATRGIVTDSILLNKTAVVFKNKASGCSEVLGSKTEAALLRLLGMREDLEGERTDEVVDRIPFSSERKWMASLVRTDREEGTGWKVFCKGAPARVLPRCTHSLLSDGRVVPLTEKQIGDISSLQKKHEEGSLRMVSFAYSECVLGVPSLGAFGENPPAEMVFVCTMFIDDPLRENANEMVGRCTDAGICVRMVTGDGMDTAVAAARRCGILTDGFDAVDASKCEGIPSLDRLRVLARATPSDKESLVKLLREHGEVVAVTGDGTNDVGALRAADIGLGMGGGTEIAKEASSIVLLDDRLSSVLVAVSWGRCVVDNIRRFLVFQLSVSIGVVVFVLVTSLSDVFLQEKGFERLTTPQMLFVNIIIDTVAALVFASNTPTENTVRRLGRERRLVLVTDRMAVLILVLSGLCFSSMLFAPFLF